MEVSSMLRDQDMGESPMVWDHDMVDSSMVWDDQVDNQIVILPEDLQHPDDSNEFQPTPNGTPYWVPNVPEDEKPKQNNDAYETYLVYSQKARFNIRKGGFKRKNGQKTHAYFQCNRAGPTRAHRLKAALVGGYGYKFVPFTGIDHNQRCVTFGPALLSDETTESFSWMLEAFLKTHKKQPSFAVTDQDGALRNAVVKMFPDSHHRL
nr:protein FAR1-related sequence 5-like [Tanacetum cinerariifolium]